MAFVKLPLSTEQFIKAFKDSIHVKKFNHEAIEIILTRLEAHQCDNDGEQWSWQEFFMCSDVLTANKVITQPFWNMLVSDEDKATIKTLKTTDRNATDYKDRVYEVAKSIAKLNGWHALADKTFLT